MADNIDVTPGTGATVATEDIDGVEYQRVKLVDGAVGSTTVVPGNGDGLYVQAPDLRASGTITASGQSVTITLRSGETHVGFDLRGTFSAGTTMTQEATLDGTNYVAVGRLDVVGQNYNNAGIAGGAATTGVIVVPPGSRAVRLRCSAFQASDSVTVTMSAAHTAQPWSLANVSVSTGTANAFLPGVHMRGWVQDLKDMGRSARTYQLSETVATTEAVRTTSRSVAGATVTTGTSWGVTSGKTCRIQSMTVSMHHTAVNFYKAWLRISDTGAVATSSPIAAVGVVQNQATQGGGSVNITFPDGLELSGTREFGISTIGGVAAGTGLVTLTTYEY